MDSDCLPTNVRVVPDLGDELLIVIDRLEALLGSVAVWEIEDDVGVTSPLRRREGAGRPADRGRRGAANPRTRRTAARVRPAAPSRLARPPRCRCTSCRYPTRRSRRWSTPCRSSPCSGPIDNLNAAVEQYTAVLGEPPLALVSCLSRTVSLLTLPWDDDVQQLWRSATAHPDKCDTELSRSEQQAYDRVVRRIDDLWSFRPGVDQPRS